MRKPDQIINDKYMSRWFLIPKNRFFNIYLHKFVGSDNDRALHDHPWWSVSFLLKGELIEVLKETPVIKELRFISKWRPYVRPAIMAHRMVLVGTEAWTLFITGPKIREWGFWTLNNLYWDRHEGKGDFGVADIKKEGSHIGPFIWVPWREFLGEE